MLQNKIALITGASTGIGKAIALKMAQNGASIAINYIGDSAPAEDVKHQVEEFGVKANIYNCDISDFSATKEMINQVVKDFGTIDILVNNAGIVRDKLILAMKEEDFDAVININLKGAFNTIKNCFSMFAKKRSGRIINISSIIGMMGNAGQANYASAKAGLIGLTKSAAKELGARGVTCNAIAPGFIETSMTESLKEETKETYIKAIPLKRMGTAEDVANAALFFASDLAAYITGEVIKVDGGMYI